MSICLCCSILWITQWGYLVPEHNISKSSVAKYELLLRFQKCCKHGVNNSRDKTTGISRVTFWLSNALQGEFSEKPVVCGVLEHAEERRVQLCSLHLNFSWIGMKRWKCWNDMFVVDTELRCLEFASVRSDTMTSVALFLWHIWIKFKIAEFLL